MRPIALLFRLALLALLLAGCAVPHPLCNLGVIAYPAGRTLHGQPLRLGLIDASRAFPFILPGPLRQAQATLAALDDVRWGFVEPAPPQDGFHQYEWDDESAALDTRVHAYQQAGFEIVMVLRAWSPWARAAAPQGGQAAAAASTPPAAEHLASYAAWVAAVVERYDADGVDDFPNLVDVDGDGQPDPVRYYQIETESGNGVWWQGASPQTAAADYVALLRTAAATARAAYPEVQILAAGLPGLDLLDGFPTAEGLEDVVTNIEPAVCGGLTALTELLAASDAYDAIALHSLADYSGLATLADWIATLTGGGARVWISGATSAPALLGEPQALRVNPLFPAQGEALWADLQNPAAADHELVETWYRAEQARLAFKKWVYAAWSGFDALLLGLEQDRPAYQNPALGLRDLAFQGLLDATDGVSAPDPRPVVHALALAQAQLSGYTAVERLPDPAPGVHAFRFTVDGLPVYVLWYDDGVAQGPQDAPAHTAVQFPVRAPQLTALTLPTARGQAGPTVEQLPAIDGAITLTLTETPVLLRGEWLSVFLPDVKR